ncbi:dienelactone hydrolase family protein [Oceanimonas pelagia]|uniref:Dienelactone hydrolase family protein n=1 Tax=Oceanimonas pelagia TaxID=3028314 RepID=A0AA50KMG5_9GAMM|nr:dienelactone hydrolase family protein [Oceanimonas pelagia]WMC09786.1 dienelactone hydrolase family protein [Oceanimonas pelagia]
MLPCVERTLGERPDACVIWLHGLGADGHDFAPIVPELKLPPNAAVRFVFPHAPAMPVTINGGLAMPAWYDILAMDIDRKVDETQLRASAAAVIELVEQQIAAGIDSRRIVLAGFSQGGAVAYEAALSFHKPLGGLIAMSTYFATAGSVVPSEASRDLPILVLHGSQDPVVSEQLGLRACRALEQLGHVPEYHRYPMAHAVCAEEIADIARFLCRCLALH